MALCMTPLRRYIKVVDQLIDFIGRSTAWLTLIMMIVTTVVVILRYVFNIGSIALQESITYMHAMVFMLGAAYTLQRNGHVRVDIFYQHFSERNKALVDALGSLFLLLPTCVFITWSCWSYVLSSWQVLESSAEPGGIPAVYLLKTLILVMTATLSLQASAEFFRNMLRFLNHSSDSSINDNAS